MGKHSIERAAGSSNPPHQTFHVLSKEMLMELSNQLTAIGLHDLSQVLPGDD